MAAGAGFTDSRGIYKYGESDSIGTLFSDFMNLGQTSTSDAVAADRSRLTTLETAVANPTVFAAASASARDAKYGDPAAMSATQRKTLQDSGVLVWRTDLNILEKFLATYNASTNPVGAATFGWYPIRGQAGTQAERNNTAGSSLTSGSYVAQSFNSFANANVTLNSATAPSTFTIIVPGWYQISAVAYTGNFSLTSGGTQRNILVNRNSTTASTNQLAGDTTTNLSSGWLSAQSTWKLVTGDVLRVFLYQDSGSALTHSSTQFSIDYLRPASV
jgi:hypothetical protein